ncbi:MAG: nitroreductase family protein [Candidatus Hydrothermarchaeota archaeon]
MELYEAINKRRSVRDFLDKDVEDEKIFRILEAAIKAPSAGNLQPWEFVLVRDEKNKRELAKAALNQNFIYEAPVVIVVCADKERSGSRYGSRGRELYCIQDTAAATMTLMLAAVAEGLGTCWVGAFHEEEVRKVINAPKNVRPLAIVPVGYPSRDGYRTGRYDLESVLHKESF